jgi:GNAT superfamily N-acetyltransferase
MILRPAARADVDEIVALIRELADYERLSDQCRPDRDALAEHLFGATPCAEVVIAEEEERTGVVGFALFFTRYSTFQTKPGIYLEDLFVRPDARGRGIGAALLAHLAALAVARGAGRLEWSVLTWNEPAIGFYERLGAERLHDWTRYRLSGDSLTRLATGNVS